LNGIWEETFQESPPTYKTIKQEETMSRYRIRFSLALVVAAGITMCLGQTVDEGFDMEVQRIIKRAEACFVISEDEEGFRILDEAMEKYRGQPQAGEFLYAKATELKKRYRTDSEKEKAKELLRQYLEQFPKGRHLPQAVGEIARDLSETEREKGYRAIINLPKDTAERPSAMVELAELISRSRPQEALALRKRLIEEHPGSGQAYRALSLLAREDFEAGRLEEAAKKLRKCLFDFTHMSCSVFEREEDLLAKIIEKRPDLKLPEGKALPEYTPDWKEGECWEMSVGVGPSTDAPARVALRGEWVDPAATSTYLGESTMEASSYMPDTMTTRTLFAYVGKGEVMDGKTCHAIHRTGFPYAYSPEVVLYIGQDDSSFIEARQGDRYFDFYSPYAMREAPFCLPHFPLRLGKTVTWIGKQHRVVQECSIKDGRAEVRLRHCGCEVVMLFSKSPIWWDEAHYLTLYYPSSRGPGVQAPMICKVTRSSRSDPALDLDAELAARSLAAKVEKSMHDNSIDEMKAAGEELLKRYPQHPFCATYLQFLGSRGSDPGTREAALDSLIRDYPNSPEAAEARRTRAQNLRGREKANALRKLIESASDKVAAMELRKQLLHAFQEVEDYQSIVDEYEKMEAEVVEAADEGRRLRSAFVDAQWPAANAYYQLGRFERVAELYEALMRPQYLERACALVRVGRFDEAIEACKGNDSRSAEMVRAFAYHGMGRMEDAAAAFERLAFDRLDPQAMTHLGLIYEQMGRQEESRRMFAQLLEKFPQRKVFTDMVLRLFTSEEPTAPLREFCTNKLGSPPEPGMREVSWNFVQKHSHPPLYLEDVYPWDINGDGYLEFVTASGEAFRALAHDLTPLWEIRDLRGVTYADFRAAQKGRLIFAYSRQWASGGSMWIDTDGKVVDEVKYDRKFEDGRMSMRMDAIEFPYGVSGQNKIIATRRKVFLRDAKGKDIWSYVLGGMPDKKSSDHGLCPATPAVQDVRAVDLDGDEKDEFLVVVEKRDIGIGMTYYLMACGGKLVLLGNDGKPRWEHDTGIVKRVTFRDCTGDGKKEMVVEAEGIRIIDADGKLLSEASPKGYDLGDYDGDGGLELFLCTSDGITVQKLDGSQLLKAEFPGGRGVAWGDVTGDGRSEIVAVTQYDLLIIAPSGKLLFSRELENREMSGVAILDTDNDGRNDILTFGREMDIYTLLHLTPFGTTAP
jgi:tetratricopeptide (TPR) repeat protein